MFTFPVGFFGGVTPVSFSSISSFSVGDSPIYTRTNTSGTRVYISEGNTNNIRDVVVNSSTGLFSSSTTHSTGSYPFGIAVIGSHLYCASWVTSQVIRYTISPGLTGSTSYSGITEPSAITASGDNSVMFFCSQNSSRLSSYKRDGSGNLTLASTNLVTSSSPRHMVANGSYLYVSCFTSKTLEKYSFNSGTGVLTYSNTEITSSSNCNAVATDTALNMIILCMNNPSLVNVYSIGGSGVLSLLSSNSLSFSPGRVHYLQSKRIFFISSGAKVYAYQLNANGSIMDTGSFTSAILSSIADLTLSPDESILYLVGVGSPSTNYRIESVRVTYS